MNDTEKSERVQILSERIKLLFTFCSDLILDIDLLEETQKALEDESSYAMSAAPILGAFNIDFEEKHFEAEFRLQRTEALINLIRVLRDTEIQRVAFSVEKKEKEKNKIEVLKMFSGRI